MGVRDALDTTGDTVHLTATSLGAGTGDNLFGPGGSLVFSDLVNFGAFPGITLNLGSGADTVFARPLTTARVTVNGNNPASAPGDLLHLLYDDVTSPVFTSNGTGAGTYTFVSAQAFSYTGFETVDAVFSPELVSDFNNNGAVDGQDFLVWQANFGVATGATREMGDADGDGDVDGRDFLFWQTEFNPGRVTGRGTGVPEPAGAPLVAIPRAGFGLGRRRLC